MHNNFRFTNKTRYITQEQKLTTIKLIADWFFDGHYCIMAFTTCFQGCYGTLNFYKEDDGLKRLQELPKFKTLDELLNYMIVSCFLDKESFAEKLGASSLNPDLTYDQVLVASDISKGLYTKEELKHLKKVINRRGTPITNRKINNA